MICSHSLKSMVGTLIQGFQEAVDACELQEDRMVGYSYTWEKSRGS